MGKSDKSLVTKTVLFCIASIILVHILCFVFSYGNFGNPVYWIVDIVLILFLAYGIKAAYKNVDTAKDNATRWFVVILTVIILIWSGGWSAGGNEKVAPG